MRRLTKTVAAIASGSLALLAVPAVGVATSGAAPKPTYTIGYQGPLSGGNQQLGLNMVFAVQLAINQANASGKLPFVLKLKTFDDQGDPTVAPSVAQSAVANKNLVAMVGPAFSGATQASMRYYFAASLPVVSPSATRVSLAHAGWTDFFRVVADDGVQGPADANYAVKKLHAKKVYVVNDASSYGAGLASAFAATAKADHASVTAVTVPGTAACQNGTASTTEYSAAAIAAKASGASLLFYGGYYCDLGLFLTQLHSVGYKGAVMSGDGANSPSLIQGTTPHSAANGVYLSCACAQSTSKAFNTQFQALSHFSAATATYAPESYDAANVIIAAMKSLKVISRKNIVAALHKIHYMGMTKAISFQPDGNIAGAAIYVSQVKNGQIVQLGLE